MPHSVHGLGEANTGMRGPDIGWVPLSFEEVSRLGKAKRDRALNNLVDWIRANEQLFSADQHQGLIVVRHVDGGLSQLPAPPSLDGAPTIEAATAEDTSPTESTKSAGQGRRPRVKQQTAYLPLPVYEQVRRLAFEENAKMHDFCRGLVPGP